MEFVSYHYKAEIYKKPSY